MWLTVALGFRVAEGNGKEVEVARWYCAANAEAMVERC